MITRRHAATWLGAGLAGSALGFGGKSEAASQSTRTPPNSWAAYETYLEKARSDWRVPGLAVAIVKDGALVFSKGFGVANVDTRAPVTADTLFGAASTTKAFTAAGIAMLVDQKKLEWDAPVTRYLPSFQLGHGDDYASLSLRDMMSHRTGLGRHDLLWYNNKSLTLEDLLARLPYLDTFAPIRSSYQYNNLMVMLAGLAVERVSGMSWEAFTKSSIFGPLGMTRSNLTIAHMARDNNHANGHRLRDKTTAFSIPLRPEDRIGPAGAVNSSVNDYAKWMILQLGRGNANSTQLFSRAQSNTMWEPFVMAGGVPSSPELTRGYYGLGWRIDAYRGMRRVAPGGNLTGFASRVTLLPEKNIGIVAFTNLGASPLPGHVTMDIVDMMLGLEPANWSARNLARRDATQPAATAPVLSPRVLATTPSRPVSALVGTFHHKGYGDLIIAPSVNSVQLKQSLHARYNDMPMALEHWHYDVFNAVPERGEDSDLADIKFAFTSGVTGQIVSVAAKMDDSTDAVVFDRVIA